MSANGLRAAHWLRRVQPGRAAVVAAELRNAITSASLAAQEIEGEPGEFVAQSVQHVLAIARALEGVKSACDETQTCAHCGLPIQGDGVMMSEQWFHGPGGCRAERILDAGSRAEVYEAGEARRG